VPFFYAHNTGERDEQNILKSGKHDEQNILKSELALFCLKCNVSPNN
jgi:hypothetical protein